MPIVQQPHRDDEQNPNAFFVAFLIMVSLAWAFVLFFTLNGGSKTQPEQRHATNGLGSYTIVVPADGGVVCGGGGSGGFGARVGTVTVERIPKEALK